VVVLLLLEMVWPLLAVFDFDERAAGRLVPLLLLRAMHLTHGLARLLVVHLLRLTVRRLLLLLHAMMRFCMVLATCLRIQRAHGRSLRLHARRQELGLKI
jgi:hypothetical protein